MPGVGRRSGDGVKTMLVRVLSLLIGAILGLSNSGAVWGAKDGIRLPGNGLIAFADAPGEQTRT